MILFLVVFCLLIAIGFGIASGVSDFKTMTISNSYAGGVIAAFIVAYLADALSGNGVEYFASWKSHGVAAIGVFAITFILFSIKVIGAGDSKLCSAFALWMGLEGLPPYLFYMAIIGALLAVATKFMNKTKVMALPAEGSWIAKAQSGHQGVPYGIAICAGAVISFLYLGYLSPEKLLLLAGHTEN